MLIPVRLSLLPGLHNEIVTLRVSGAGRTALAHAVLGWYEGAVGDDAPLVARLLRADADLRGVRRRSLLKARPAEILQGVAVLGEDGVLEWRMATAVPM